MRPVLRLKKNAAAKLTNTIVIKGVASPNRNQAIAQSGKENEDIAHRSQRTAQETPADHSAIRPIKAAEPTGVPDGDGPPN